MPEGIRVITWFSCGAASAVAAKLAVEKYGPSAQVVYCDTSANEHPDSARFLSDVEGWLGTSIVKIRSSEYSDIYDVFKKTRYLVGPFGARCTTELKKVPRKDYQRVDDVHVFGFTLDEEDRIARFSKGNPELRTDFILRDAGMRKSDCYSSLVNAGIRLPEMYRLGYDNNNCVGCVKGGMGYWNKIRKDFPDVFQRMAAVERDIGIAICRKGRKKVPVFLDELPPRAGRYKSEPKFECGVLCG